MDVQQSTRGGGAVWEIDLTGIRKAIVYGSVIVMGLGGLTGLGMVYLAGHSAERIAAQLGSAITAHGAHE